TALASSAPAPRSPSRVSGARIIAPAPAGPRFLLDSPPKDQRPPPLVSSYRGGVMEALRDRLAEVLKRGWWSLLLRGVVAIAFAVLTWLQPQISLTALVYVFGFYALVDGILAAGAAIAGRNLSRSWWMLLLSGLVGIAVGVLTFMRPGITALGLLVYI